MFSSGLRKYTGGEERVTVDATSVRALIVELERRFPGLGPQLESGMALAIDGEIIADPLLEPVHPQSEIHFLPKIGGG